MEIFKKIKLALEEKGSSVNFVPYRNIDRCWHLCTVLTIHLTHTWKIFPHHTLFVPDQLCASPTHVFVIVDYLLSYGY